MIEHLIYACVLVLIQAWVLPAAFNTKNMQWMLSNRDANPDTTLYYDRSKKAFANLQESIPVFFLLGLLGVITSCLLYTSPSPRDRTRSRMPSSA